MTPHRAHIRFARLLLSALAASSFACGGREPSIAVISAQEVGVVDTQPTIQGRDGGFSIHTWGRSVWVYGDTVLTVPDEDGLTWHHNSFSTTADLDASDGITGATERLDAAGAPLHFLAPTADERAFNLAHAGENCQEPCNARWATWPTSAVYDAERDRVLVFYGKIYAEPGDFNFHGVGHSIAVWDEFDALLRRPELAPGSEHPTIMFPTGDRQVGLAPTHGLAGHRVSHRPCGTQAHRSVATSDTRRSLR